MQYLPPPLGEHAAGGFVGGTYGMYTQNYAKGAGDMDAWEENAPSGQNTAAEGKKIQICLLISHSGVV